MSSVVEYFFLELLVDWAESKCVNIPPAALRDAGQDAEVKRPRVGWWTVLDGIG